MKEKFNNGMLIVATRLQSQRHFSAIKNGFTTLLPIIIVGSFCTLFSNVICNTTEGYFSLANVPGLSFLGNLKPIFAAANYGTMNFLAIAIAVLIAIELGGSYGIQDKALPMVSLASYISLCTTSTVFTDPAGSVHSITDVLAVRYTGAQGLFVAMLVALASAEIYCRLVKGGRMEIKMPESVPPNVSRSFTILFPSAITILLVSAVGLIFSAATGLTVFDAIVRFIQKPLAHVLTGLPGYLFLVFMSTLLWSFGIHGTQTLKAVYEPILLAAFAENEAAYLAGAGIPNIINTPFMSCFSTMTGAGVTGGLLIAIFLFSKREDYRAIGRLAIPCAVFNINEPLVFGLPIVMNPILVIPFMIAPAVSAAFAYFMTTIGFCGRMVVNAPWTTPPVLMGLLSSGGSVGAAVTQLICILLSAVVYAPFVIAANKQPAESEYSE